MAVATRVAIAGWTGCSFFQKARTALLGMSVLAPLEVEVVEHSDRDSFRSWWFSKRESLGPRAIAHGSSPAVWLNDTDVSAHSCESPHFSTFPGAVHATPPQQLCCAAVESWR